MPGEKALTPKQAAFARAYLEHGNASLAYRMEYKSEGMNDNTIKRNAHTLLHNPKVQAELERLRAAINNKTATTIETLVQEQDNAMALALETRNATAYASASMNKAKLLGFLVDKVDQRVTQVEPNDTQPDIAQLWARTGHSTDTGKDTETKH